MLYLYYLFCATITAPDFYCPILPIFFRISYDVLHDIFFGYPGWDIHEIALSIWDNLGYSQDEV